MGCFYADMNGMLLQDSVQAVFPMGCLFRQQHAGYVLLCDGVQWRYFRMGRVSDVIVMVGMFSKQLRSMAIFPNGTFLPSSAWLYVRASDNVQWRYSEWDVSSSPMEGMAAAQRSMGIFQTGISLPPSYERYVLQGRQILSKRCVFRLMSDSETDSMFDRFIWWSGSKKCGRVHYCSGVPYIYGRLYGLPRYYCAQKEVLMLMTTMRSKLFV
jgi:hypothetical protein